MDLFKIAAFKAKDPYAETEKKVHAALDKGNRSQLLAMTDDKLVYLVQSADSYLSFAPASRLLPYVISWRQKYA